MDQGDKEKAATFSKYLERVFRPINGVDTSIVEQLKEEPQTLLQFSTRIRLFTVAEVKWIICKSLNPEEPPDLDLITGRILKKPAKETIILLTVIYNALLSYYEYELISRDFSV